MRILFDTSALIPALVRTHPFHTNCRPWLNDSVAGRHEGHISVHTLAELYSALTNMPTTPRISPSLAVQLAQDAVGLLQTVSLTAKEYLRTLEDAAAMGVIGGLIHDAVIAAAARKANVDRLLTLNVPHFLLVWPQGRDIICERRERGQAPNRSAGSVPVPISAALQERSPPPPSCG
jgi:predicted nucleic acid-binding protein